jgi:hypothetical protein
MQRLSSDAAATAGEHWRDVNTVGKVAEDAVQGLRERLAQPQGDGNGEGSEGNGQEGS